MLGCQMTHQGKAVEGANHIKLSCHGQQLQETQHVTVNRQSMSSDTAGVPFLAASRTIAHSIGRARVGRSILAAPAHLVSRPAILRFHPHAVDCRACSHNDTRLLLSDGRLRQPHPLK